MTQDNETPVRGTFGKLSSMKVEAGKTIVFEYPEILNADGSSPCLTCLPATRENPEYFNHLLKKNRRHSRQLRAGKIDAKLAATLLDCDKTLYPLHVVVGWKNVFFDDGKPAEFTKGNAIAWFEALPNDLFDTLRAEVGDIGSFRDDADDGDENDDEEHAKN